jgi:hypothetical protein
MADSVPAASFSELARIGGLGDAEFYKRVTH